MLKSIITHRLFALGCFLLILAGSSVPSNRIPSVFKLTPDKLIHCFEYGVYGFFLALWISSEFKSKSATTQIILTLLIGWLCGMTDELYQHLTPGRTPDFYDWCLDAVGIVLGLLLFKGFISKWPSVFTER